MELVINDSGSMERLGAALAAAVLSADRRHTLINLQGPLGAGKTTLVRGFLRGCGVSGPIKSPTYTLIEPYQVGERAFYHFDLYRLEDPEALEMLGVRDYFSGDSVCLIEWPEQAGGLLPAATVEVRLALEGTGRRATLTPATEHGASLLKSFNFAAEA